METNTSVSLAQAKSLVNGYTDGVTPTTGQTVAFRNTNDNGTLVIAPAGTIAALTISLPANATSDIGQEIFAAFEQTVTTVTITNGTLMGSPGTASAGEGWLMKKTRASTWTKVS